MPTIFNTATIHDAMTPEQLHSSSLRIASGLALRGVHNLLRLPSAFLPAMLMPIFTTIAFSGTFAAVTKLPGFPTDRSVNWYMPLGVCFGSAFSGVGLGFSTIRDIETGFYDRLRMSPAPRSSLILGPLFTTWFRALILCLVVIPIGTILGVRFNSSFLGVVTLVAASLGIATICLGWGLGIAFRFRDMRGAAVMQLGLITGLYLSSAQMPLPLTTGWLHTVARFNPVTNILRLAREGLVSPSALDAMSWSSTWGGLAAIIGLSLASLWFAIRGLSKLGN